jgi:hypothetical protein
MGKAGRRLEQQGEVREGGGEGGKEGGVPSALPLGMAPWRSKVIPFEEGPGQQGTGGRPGASSRPDPFMRLRHTTAQATNRPPCLLCDSLRSPGALRPAYRHLAIHIATWHKTLIRAKTVATALAHTSISRQDTNNQKSQHNMMRDESIP